MEKQNNRGKENEYKPCEMTPSSRSACHIPAAWALVCMLEERLRSQSTSSVPGAHRRTSRPETLRSLRQVFWAEKWGEKGEKVSLRDLQRRRVLKAQPIRPIIVLGDSVIGSAGLGWSGDIDRRGGGEMGCCITPPFEPLTDVPKPGEDDWNRRENWDKTEFFIMDEVVFLKTQDLFVIWNEKDF